MRKKRFKKGSHSRIISMILPLIIFAIIFALVAASLKTTSRSVGSEGVRIAEEAVRRAAVSCYAIEGSYPESYEYLIENYGLAINTDRYVVHYSIFASNLMPEITVISKEAQQ